MHNDTKPGLYDGFKSDRYRLWVHLSRDVRLVLIVYFLSAATPSAGSPLLKFWEELVKRGLY